MMTICRESIQAGKPNVRFGGLVRIVMLALAAAYSCPAFSAQTDISISTTAPPATPRILGATVVASTPGSPFLHTISATGQAPLTFAATGLPDGLLIAASSVACRIFFAK